MTVQQLRRELKQRIDNLDDDRLRSAADYVAYLDDASDPVASGMIKRIRNAEQEIAQGQVTPVARLRRKG